MAADLLLGVDAWVGMVDILMLAAQGVGYVDNECNECDQHEAATRREDD